MRQYIVIGLLLFALVGAATVSAWEDCPFGITNDPWPGQCNRYWDSDDNGICDHSELAPADRNVAVIDPDTGDTIVPDYTANQGDDTEIDTSPQRVRTYHVLEITIFLSVFYFITNLASKEGQMTPATHKKLWNWLLLGTFLVAGILGLILATTLSYGLVFPFSDSLYIHVEFGIAMAIISIFHVLWHWNYYAKGFSKEEEKKKQKNNKKKRRN